MTKSIVCKGIVKTQPTQESESSCGFFLGGIPVKVYQPCLTDSVMDNIRMGMRVRIFGRLSQFCFVAEKIEIQL